MAYLCKAIAAPLDEVARDVDVGENAAELDTGFASELDTSKNLAG